jgi:hypothetical protein
MRAADGAGNAAVECQTRNTGLLRGARHHDVEDRGAGGDARAVNADLVEAAAHADDDARHAAVAHDQVGAGADDGDWNVGRQIAQRVSQIVFVFRHQQRLRRPADAEPGELGQRLIGHEPPAQLRQAGFHIRNDIRKAHSAFNSPGSA